MQRRTGMARDSWYKAWREAYLDLHAAYLAVLRVRHQRNQSLELVIQRDMEREDPFKMKSASGKDGVKRWREIWGKHAGKDVKSQVMSACTEAINNHWGSWKAFMDLCPEDLRKYKIDMPQGLFLTSTAVSRGSLEQRAKVLAEAWKRHIKGNA
jgi:hypothetical protein